MKKDQIQAIIKDHEQRIRESQRRVDKIMEQPRQTTKEIKLLLGLSS